MISMSILKTTYKTKSLFFVALAVFATMFFYACTKDKFDFSPEKFKGMSIKPQIAVPLVKSELTLENLITTSDSNELISVDPETGMMTIYYQDSLFSFSGKDLISIPDMDAGFSFGLGSALNFNGKDSIALKKGTYIFDSTIMIDSAYKMTLDFPSEVEGDTIKVDSIHLSSGSLNLSLRSNFKNKTTIKYSIPSVISSNGEILSDSIVFDYNGYEVLPMLDGVNIDLTGYTLDLSSMGAAFNTVDIIYSVAIQNEGEYFTKNDSIDMSMSITGMDFSEVMGYMGRNTFELDLDTINLGLFNSTINGNFRIANPKFNISVDNYFGLPINAEFITFKAYSGEGEEVDFTDIYNNPINISMNYPSFKEPNEIGQSANTEISFTNATTNIVDVISLMPDYIVYDIEAYSNPMGETMPHENFLINDSKFSVSLDVELPLYGSAEDFLFLDTLDFQSQTLKELKDATLRFVVSNGFPVDIGIQLYFADENYNVLDSLLTPDNGSEYYEFVSSGKLDANGKVIEPTTNVSDILISESVLNKIESTKYIMIKANLNTTNNGITNVRFLDSYGIDILLGAKAQFDVDLSNTDDNEN